MRGIVIILILLLPAIPAFASEGSNLGDYGRNFKPAVLTGKVTLKGAPVPSAMVSTFAGHSTKTDVSGNYTLPVDAPGIYTVIFKSGARAQTRTTEVALGQTTVVDVSLPTYSVDPNKGTTGSKFTIVGENFGSSPGKVTVGKGKCTVVDWADTSVHAVLLKARIAGANNVQLTGGSKGSSPIVLQSAFNVIGPSINSLDPQEGQTGNSITIHGDYFGTAKIKVTLQYIQKTKTRKKNCKVLSWNMDPETGASQVVFEVPKGLPPGPVRVVVTNLVASGAKEDALTIK